MKGAFLLLLLLLLKVFSVNGCSCVEGALRRSRVSAIKDDICNIYSRDVYAGTVMAATCNCIPVDMQSTTNEATFNQFLNCQRYQWDPDSGQSVISSSIIARGGCARRYDDFSISNCSAVGISLAAAGLRLEDVQQTVLPDLMNNTDANGFGCDFTCPFNSMVDEEYGFFQSQPCIYMVRVDEVFKGNYSSGEVIEVRGPDVLTSCGTVGRVLEVSTSYVVGIGHACSPISGWTETESYSTEELQLLRDFPEDVTCDEVTLLPPSLKLCLFIVIVVAVFVI